MRWRQKSYLTLDLIREFVLLSNCICKHTKQHLIVLKSFEIVKTIDSTNIFVRQSIAGKRKAALSRLDISKILPSDNCQLDHRSGLISVSCPIQLPTEFHQL